MKVIILIVAIATSVTFMSCTQNGNDVVSINESLLKVQADFGEPVTKASISVFPNGAEIGLFVTSGSLGSNYNNLSANENVRSVYNSSSRTWSQTPVVYLSPAAATIFAYYPYTSGYKDGTAIPIEHGTQTDYLFGTHTSSQTAVNSGYPNVSLTMRHALSLLQFKINRSNYSGNGVVTKIEVSNATGKTVICSAGKLNISTGIISKTSGQNNSAFIQKASGLYTIPVSASSVEDQNLRLMVLPTSTTVAVGDVKMYFTIDGKVYTYEVPASTIWNMGTKNTYTITLSGTELVVGNVSITDWVTGVSESATLR